MDNDLPSHVAAAVAALDQVRQDWQRRSGVTGIDVGFLWEEGRMTDQVGIRVMVEKVLAPEDVPPGELFPDSLEGIRVQVRQHEGYAPQPASEATAVDQSSGSAEGGNHHASETIERPD